MSFPLESGWRLSMKERRCLIVGLVCAVVLCLTTSMALAKDACQKQNAKIRNISVSVIDPELCAPYELCQFFEVIGTLNGSGGWFRDLDWTTVVAGDTVVLWAEAKIETNKGDVWLKERCVLHLVTLHASCTSMVWGGTGEFDGATGWLAHAPSSQSGAFPDTTQLLRGEICLASD